MRRLALLAAALVGLLHLTTVTAPASAPAQAAVCTALQPNDLRYDSPYLTASVTPTSDACWLLPDGAGTVYQLGLDAATRLPLEFVDATGANACSAANRGLNTCTLVGEAPFTMRTARLHFIEPPQVTLQVFRLTGDSGCPLVQPNEFGSAREVAVELSLGEFHCMAIDMDDSSTPFVNATVGTDRLDTYVRTVDETGATLCATALCPGPESGRGLVLTTRTNQELREPVTYRLSLWDLASPAGCRSGLDRRWGTPSGVGSLASRSQVDCWWVDARQGDLLLNGIRAGVAPVFGLYLDPTGLHDCSSSNSPCSADSSPMRMIVAGRSPAGASYSATKYAVAVRSLAPDAGCIPITPLAFGEAPSDRHPGVGCRWFTARAGVPYRILTHELSAEPVVLASVYNHRGEAGCSPVPPVGGFDECVSEGGRLSIVDDVVSADFVTTLIDMSSDAGCRPWRLGGLSYIRSSYATGQVDCYAVTPSGSASPVVQSYGESVTPPVVQDDQGEIICRGLTSCTLSGSSRYRVLFGGRSAFQDFAPRGVYYTVGADPSVARECVSVPFGRGKGLLVRVTAEKPVTCVRITPSGRPVEALHYRRVRGTGVGALGLLPSAEGVGCYGDAPDLTPAASGSWSCDVPGRIDLVLMAGARDQTYYVSRTDGYTREPPVPGMTQLTATRRPTINGSLKPGERLTASPGRWSPSASSYRFVWKVGGKVVAGADGRRLAVRPGYAGKKVTVTVTASAPNLFPGSATSLPVRVRGR